MKTFIITIAILLTSIYNPGNAQELIQKIKPDSYRSNSNNGKRNKLNRSRINEDFNPVNTITDTLMLLSKENYNPPENYSRNFVRTANGHSYEGTKKGIKMWDNYTFIWITTDNSNIPENNITALSLDQNDHLWIGTYSSGLVIGIGDPIKPFRIQPVHAHDKNIFSITTDKFGLVWVVFQNGSLECFRNGISCAFFPNSDMLRDN